MYGGESKDIRVTITDDNGNPLDLGPLTTMSYTLSTGRGNGVLISKTLASGIVKTTPTSGICTITLAAADTSALRGTYYHQLEVIDSSSLVSVVMSGFVVIR